MGTLVTRTHRFACQSSLKVITSGEITNKQHENFNVPARVFRAFIRNTGKRDIVVDLDGSSNNIGWTNRGSVVVTAGGSAPLEGAIRGGETYFRFTARATSSGDPYSTEDQIRESEGILEIYDESDHFTR